ncbi:hypothetical protein BH20ACT3_BH20ACT3_14320 [soil metagenome]
MGAERLAIVPDIVGPVARIGHLIAVKLLSCTSSAVRKTWLTSAPCGRWLTRPSGSSLERPCASSSAQHHQLGKVDLVKAQLLA